MSVRADEDICLEKRERVIEVSAGNGPYDLKVLVEDIQLVHVFHTARYFQQLALGC